VKCRATLRSGTTELKLFTKIVLRLEAGEQSLQFDAANDLLHNAGFYSRYLSEFEGDIVPRHYGVKKSGARQSTVQFSSISLDCRGQVLRTDLGILWRTSKSVF